MSVPFKTDVHPAMCGDVHVMGLLRSTKAGGRVALWKKHFWVANLAQSRLEYYKNDQAINPLGVIDARQIMSVNTDADKHSKFFFLSLKLREKKVRDFRMNSVAERDRWFEAVLALIRSARSTDRVQNLVATIQRRIAQVSKEVGLGVALSDLSGVPAELLPHCLDAIESGLDLVRAIAASKCQALTRLRSVTLFLRKGGNEGGGGGGDGGGGGSGGHKTHYDPLHQRLNVAVSVYFDGSGNAEFRHIDPTGAIKLLSSSIWRDPSIEGWLTLDREAKLQRERIATLLGVEDFNVSLQWSDNIEAKSNAIGAYLAEHVGAKLLSRIYDVILRLCRAEDDIEKEEEEEEEEEERSGDGERGALLAQQQNSQGGSVLSPRPSATFPPRRRRRMTAVECIGQYVTGVSVFMDSDTIQRGAPPVLMLTHTMWEHTHFHAAYALTSLFRRAHTPPTPKDAMDDLRMQLRDVLLHVRLSAACVELERRLSDTLGLRDGATINWEKLLAALQNIGADGFPEHRLPAVITAVVTPYMHRAAQLVAYLKRTRQLENPFLMCVASFRISFRCLADQGPSGELGVFRGAFSEAVILANANTTSAAELQTACEGSPIRVMVSDIDAILAYPTAQLSAWFGGYLAHPANLVPAPVKVEYGDGDDDDDDDDDDDVFGEIVAVERSGETRILSLRDVVNAVYDSQGGELALMASAEVIRAGADALQRAFPIQSISKHDLVRVLSHALKRLRTLTAPFQSPPELTPETCVRILKMFCEYAESETSIADAVRAAMTTVTVAGAGCGEALRYTELARIALAELLPTDVVLAVRSRRTVLLIGLDNTGKTMIQHALRGISRPTYPTIGVTECIVAYREWAINFKELGGRPELRKHWKQYIPLIGDVDGVVFVVDAMLPSSFADARKYLKSALSHKAFAGLPVLLLVNNFHGTPEAAEVVAQLDFESVTKNAGQPHHAATCCVAIPQHRPAIDSGLARGLDWLCGALRDASQPQMVPPLPKDCTAADPSTA